MTFIVHSIAWIYAYGDTHSKASCQWLEQYK